MKVSRIVKRSVVLDGNKTSVSLEDIYWIALQEMAAANGKSMAGFLNQLLDTKDRGVNISSYIRQHVIHRYRQLLKLPSRDGANEILREVPFAR